MLSGEEERRREDMKARNATDFGRRSPTSS